MQNCVTEWPYTIPQLYFFSWRLATKLRNKELFSIPITDESVKLLSKAITFLEDARLRWQELLRYRDMSSKKFAPTIVMKTFLYQKKVTMTQIDGTARLRALINDCLTQLRVIDFYLSLGAVPPISQDTIDSLAQFFDDVATVDSAFAAENRPQGCFG